MALHKIVIGIACFSILGLLPGCGKKDNPAGPVPDPRTTLITDAFETDLNDPAYRPYIMTGRLGKLDYMTITNAQAHGGSKSLTSDSNFTAIEKIWILWEDTSTIGIEFYLYATKGEQTNFIASIGKAGSSSMGTHYYLGMGFDKSDSIKCVYRMKADTAEQKKCIAPITYNKWIKCTVEYDLWRTKTATYFIDGQQVYSVVLDEPYGFDLYFACRDGEGTDGPKQYYLDDVRTYHKK